MRIQISILALCLATVAVAVASPAVPTYSEARVSWEAHKDGKDYQTYADEFIQFNNHYHFDEKDGCYALAGGAVQLMLVITHRDGEKYALVEDVLTDTDSPKAQCFKKTYRGIRTKVPPFLPFIFQMSMG